MKKTNLALASLSLLTLISANPLHSADVGTVNLSLPINLVS